MFYWLYVLFNIRHFKKCLYYHSYCFRCRYYKFGDCTRYKFSADFYGFCKNYLPSVSVISELKEDYRVDKIKRDIDYKKY